MMISSKRSVRQSGFTLIEVMIVIVLIGLMVSTIQFAVQADSPEEALKKESMRFAGFFEIATEYSMLNNLELGLVIKKESYQLVFFDGERWAAIEDNSALTAYQLPEAIEIEIILDDLPIDEPQLYDANTFKLEEEDDFSESSFDSVGFEKETLTEEELIAKKTKFIPQVYILSGGDITPFSLRFYFNEEAFLDNPPHYLVTGLYSTPLTIDGPLFNE